MKKILIVLVLVLVSFSLSAYSAWGGDELPFVESGVLIPLGSSIYSKMDALFVLAGYGVPSTSRPWTVAEARNELLVINRATLKEDLYFLYDELYLYLFQEDKNTISLTLSLSPEVYLHTNSSYNREEYWNYGYDKRNHFGAISLDNATHGVYGHLELSGGKSVIGKDDAASAITIREYVESMGKSWEGIGTLLTKEDGDYKVIASQKNYSDIFSYNVPTLTDSDMNMPRRAYLDWANSFMNIGIYKAQKSWGYNRGGNFVFDTHNDFYNWVGLKTYSKNFNFEYSLMFPEYYKGGTNFYTSLDENRKCTRVFAAHMVEFRLFDKVKVLLSENIMYRFYDYFDVTQLNPGTFFHNNVNNQHFNSLAYVEFEWSIIPSLLLYGSWVCDQGSFPGLEDRKSEDQAMGFSLGVEYDTIIMGGISRFSIEGIYTNPALYRPTGCSDFIINYNAINVSDYFKYPFFTYIGYKYGGDTISVRGDADWRKGDLYLYSSLEVRIDGEFTLYDKYNSPMLISAPSGNIDVTTTFNLGCEYGLKLWNLLPVEAFADISIIKSKKRGFDCQLALGCSISYSLTSH